MKFSVHRWGVALALGLLCGAGFASDEDDGEAKDAAWEELTVELPAFPQEQNWLPFYVSASTKNSFFVDTASISVGSDGVVRYALLIRSASGARNVSFEGMRCETRERRLYATGRAGGEWAKSRSGGWSRIRDEYANRHHAALFLDYFCPGGLIARDADEIRAVLRRDAGRW